MEVVLTLGLLTVGPDTPADTVVAPEPPPTLRSPR